MKFHDELNQKIFNGEELKPEVRDKLLEIADAFIEFLEVDEDAIKDIVITGSMVSYNYTKYSDIDLHLKVDFDKIHEDCPIVQGYLWQSKAMFNKNHDIFIYGIPVEVYAESIDEDTIHNGLYSLRQDKWIDFPEKIEPTDNDSAVEAKFQEFKDMADNINDSEEAEEIIDKLYIMRKAGLEDGGEFSTENLAFKKVRDAGILEKLKEKKKAKIDKQLSLESYNESLKDDIQNLFKKYPFKTTGQTSSIGEELDKLPKGTEISYKLDNDWHDCWNYFTKTDLDKYNWAYKYVVDGKVVRQKGMISWDVAGTIRADGMEDKLIVKESKNESLFKKELTPLPKKKPSLKIGDEVKINGINGKIIKLKNMKMSNTPVYQIKLENGKTVWRYEEELNESVKDVKGGWFDKIVTFENDNYKMECYIKGIKVASCYIIRKKDNNTIMQLIDPKYDKPLGLDEKCRAWNTLREYMQRMADRKNIQINFEEIEGMKEEFIIRAQSEIDGAAEQELCKADSEVNAEEAGKEELKQLIADKKSKNPKVRIYKRDPETNQDTLIKDITPTDLEEHVDESVDHLSDKIDYVNSQLKELIQSITRPEPVLAESYESLSAKIKQALGE